MEKAFAYSFKDSSLPEKCINCYDFPYCGGPKPCDTLECTGLYRKKDAARDRIIAYIELNELLQPYLPQL